MPLAHGSFKGICRGGPWDGKIMEHDRPEYRVPIRSRLQLQIRPPHGIVDLKWGVYRHVAYNWVWRDADHQDVRMPGVQSRHGGGAQR